MKWPRDRVLLGTALFAMVWLVARAHVQSVTIDEADTWLSYAGSGFPGHWTPAANNHVLNSMLIRLFTSIFGLWHLSLRAPALMGAAIYIASAYFVTTVVAERRVVRWGLFVCLVYNPFVMDYLVAARGYGLALGFLMAAVAIGVSARTPGGVPALQAESLRHKCAAASVCAGLSFAASFPFAVANAAVMLWIWARHRDWRLVWACVLPGVVVALFLTGPVLWNWPAGALGWGSSSLVETARTVIAASLYEVNPFLVNPPLARFLTRWRFFLLGAVLAALMWEVVRHGRRPPVLVVDLAAIAAGTLAVHWVVFHAFGLLLPRDRTVLYVVPLVTLAFGAAVGASRRLSVGALALLVMAGYFLCCLRLGHFYEWKWNADGREAYDRLAYYNHCYGVADVANNWRYTAVLNFYRAQSGRESFPKFGHPAGGGYPAGRQAYVLFWGEDREFIREAGLRVVYRGPRSDVTIAVQQAAAGSCSAALPVPR